MLKSVDIVSDGRIKIQLIFLKIIVYIMLYLYNYYYLLLFKLVRQIKLIFSQKIAYITYNKSFLILVVTF